MHILAILSIRNDAEVFPVNVFYRALRPLQAQYLHSEAQWVVHQAKKAYFPQMTVRCEASRIEPNPPLVKRRSYYSVPRVY
jgi:hypothetical protein